MASNAKTPPAPHDSSTSDDRTKLFEAVKNGRDADVRALLGRKSLVLEKDDTANSLREAAALGFTEIVRLLIDANASVNYSPEICGKDTESESEKPTQRPKGAIYGQVSHGRTALQAAVEGGHTEIVSILLDSGVDVGVSVSQTYGRTVLQAAAESGYTEIVSILLKHGADINAPPSETWGKTALQAAAGGGHAEIVSTLLKAGADIEAPPSEAGGRTALQAAAEGGHAEMVSTLLKANANINAQPSGKYGRTALQAAAGGEDVKVVLMLLKAGAEINAPPSEEHGRTALQAAAGTGNAEIVSILQKAGADINAPPSEYSGRTALQAAAGGGHVKVVLMLLKAGAKFNAPPSEEHGRTALQAAAETGNAEIVSILQKAGADINAPPSKYSGRTALQAAAESGHAGMVSTLLKAGAHSNALPSEYSGRTALQAAAGSGHAEIVSILLKTKANAEAQSPEELQLETEIISTPQQAGAEINALPSENSGRTALQAAAGGGHAEIVVTLLEAGAEINAPPSRYSGRSALQAAAEHGHVKIVSILLEAKADIEVQPSELHGRTALQAAAESGNTEIVSMLLDSGANVNAAPSKWHGRTALQAAAEGGHAEVVSTLLKADAHSNALPSEYSGRTALQAAAGRGHAEIVSILLKAMADDKSPSKNDRGAAAEAAAEAGHADIVSVLIDSSTNPGSMRDLNVTRMYKAISEGDQDTMNALLNNGLNANTCDTDGLSFLHHAVSGRVAESLIPLLENGAQTERRDYANRTPLDIALSLKLPLIPKVLAKFGCDIRGRRMHDWHKGLRVGETDIILMDEVPAKTKKSGDEPSKSTVREKPVIAINVLQNPLKLGAPFPGSSKPIRRLYFGSWAQVNALFSDNREVEGAYKLKIRPRGSASQAIQWGWSASQGWNQIYGDGFLNSEALAAIKKEEGLLACHVSFDFLSEAPDTEKEKRGTNKSTRDRAFRVKAEKSEISWIMRKSLVNHNVNTNQGNSASKKPDPGPGSSTSAKPDLVFRTVEFISTLNIGWIPDNAMDFFDLFVLDLHKKWRVFLEKANLHLDESRKILLNNKGKTTGFIESLLLDAQNWSYSQALLQTQIGDAKALLQDFKEKRYLCDEGKEKDAAIDKLSKTIANMENEIKKEINDLDKKTGKMIELEFNLVSIYEARTSKMMGLSMKRLSWITFVFLPLMFVASLFGMNVDLLSGGPHWTWVIKISGLVLGLVILAWTLWKFIFLLEPYSNVPRVKRLKKISGDLTPGWLGAMVKKKHLDDLESGKTPEFKAPPRRWTKLKDY